MKKLDVHGQRVGVPVSCVQPSGSREGETTRSTSIQSTVCWIECSLRHAASCVFNHSMTAYRVLEPRNSLNCNRNSVAIL